MAGSTNFLQWDTALSNMQTDAAFAGDSQRSGGAAAPSLFASSLANKLFYQLSTMVAALGQVMATAGQAASDANLANLVAAIQATFAMLNGSASQAFSAANGATGKQVVNISQCASLLAANGWQALPGGMLLQWGNRASVFGATAITLPVAFPTAGLAALSSWKDAFLPPEGIIPFYGVSTLSTTTITLYTDYHINMFWCAIGH